MVRPARRGRPLQHKLEIERLQIPEQICVRGGYYLPSKCRTLVTKELFDEAVRIHKQRLETDEEYRQQWGKVTRERKV